MDEKALRGIAKGAIGTLVILKGHGYDPHGHADYPDSMQPNLAEFRALVRAMTHVMGRAEYTPGDLKEWGAEYQRIRDALVVAVGDHADKAPERWLVDDLTAVAMHLLLP